MQIGHNYSASPYAQQANGGKPSKKQSHTSPKQGNFLIADKRDTISFAGKPKTFFS
jgi:hypothetical protein